MLWFLFSFVEHLVVGKGSSYGSAVAYLPRPLLTVIFFLQTAPTLINYDKEKGLLNLKWITIAACSTTSSTPPPTTPSEPDTNLPGKPPIGESDSSWGFFSYFFTLYVQNFELYKAQLRIASKQTNWLTFSRHCLSERTDSS